jgi:NAD(P) transhydrogenase subunit alpha
MKVGIPAEIAPGERRVGATPTTVKKLIKLGFEVVVECGAGEAAGFDDASYREAGAEIAADAGALWGGVDLVTKINAPLDTDTGNEVDQLREGGMLISLLFPFSCEALLERIAAKKGSALALDKIPRISRAQKMDVLSSQSNIAGYRGVVEAASLYNGFFGGQITAAGRTAPAVVLVIGAGVAGLAAIAAARALGAIVRSFDVRLAAREQVESLGAEFLELQFEGTEDGETAGGYAKIMSDEFIAAEMACFAEQASQVDVVVTTALIPGRPAPKLWKAEHVDAMKAGSIVIDLAAERGGNCDYTEPDEVVDVNGVKVVGYTDLTSKLARPASEFFGANVVHLLTDLGGGENFALDLEDEVVRKSLAVHDGAVIWPPPRDPPKPEVKASEKPTVELKRPKAKVVVSKSKSPSKKGGHGHGAPPASTMVATLALGGFLAVSSVIGLYAPNEFIEQYTVFVLAIFIGYQVVWNVTPALHTPLMSVTNAISGIIVVGGLLQAASGEVDTASILGAVAILVATINIAGGFLVTERMLQMFSKEG